MPDMQLGADRVRAALERELAGYKTAGEGDNVSDEAKAKYQRRAAAVEAELAKLDKAGDGGGVEEAGGGSARGRSGRRD